MVGVTGVGVIPGVRTQSRRSLTTSGRSQRVSRGVRLFAEPAFDRRGLKDRNGRIGTPNPSGSLRLSVWCPPD